MNNDAWWFEMLDKEINCPKCHFVFKLADDNGVVNLSLAPHSESEWEVECPKCHEIIHFSPFNN